MKKALILLAVVAASAFCAPAQDASSSPAAADSLTAAQLAARAGGMWKDSGIYGFMTAVPRPYVSGDKVQGIEDITDERALRMVDRDQDGNPTGTLSYGIEQGYYDQKGAFVPGHEVHMLFGMPYGLGQLLMVEVVVFLI